MTVHAGGVADPQRVAGQAGRDRVHDVLVLGERGRGACARDHRVAQRGVLRDHGVSE